MLGFEKRKERPLSSRGFMLRMVRTLAVILVLVGISLFIGMLGYHLIEGMPWVDAFLNASMILGGMGPVDPMKTDAGKIFAGCYALFSGLAFLAMAGLIFGPIAHRILHRFHYEEDKEDS
jgi:hypothetical protein